MSTVPVVFASDGWHDSAFGNQRYESQGVSDRRRLARVTVAIPLRLEDLRKSRGLEGAELVNLVELSLGDATLEFALKPRLQVARRLILVYGGVEAELTIVPYRCWLHQLFYNPSRRSRVLYRARGRFVDPSVPALNLIHRILRDHWQAERRRSHS